ncbi:MAG: hypothetical protein P8103_20265 [Candidatus Thiodiazotropha sp.]
MVVDGEIARRAVFDLFEAIALTHGGHQALTDVSAPLGVAAGDCDHQQAAGPALVQFIQQQLLDLGSALRQEQAEIALRLQGADEPAADQQQE